MLVLYISLFQKQRKKNELRNWITGYVQVSIKKKEKRVINQENKPE